MYFPRRAILAGMGAVALTACARRFPVAATVTSDSLPTAPDPGWDAWVAGFRNRALADGITPATFDRAFASAGFTPGVVERDRNQTETRRTFEEYLAITADEARVAEGKAKLAQHGATLSAIEQRYGVPAHVTCAIWGIERDVVFGHMSHDWLEPVSGLAPGARLYPIAPPQGVPGLHVDMTAWMAEMLPAIYAGIDDRSLPGRVHSFSATFQP